MFDRLFLDNSLTDFYLTPTILLRSYTKRVLTIAAITELQRAYLCLNNSHWASSTTLRALPELSLAGLWD
jgi:hypothetical protein